MLSNDNLFVEAQCINGDRVAIIPADAKPGDITLEIPPAAPPQDGLWWGSRATCLSDHSLDPVIQMFISNSNIVWFLVGEHPDLKSVKSLPTHSLGRVSRNGSISLAGTLVVTWIPSHFRWEPTSHEQLPDTVSTRIAAHNGGDVSHQGTHNSASFL